MSELELLRKQLLRLGEGARLEKEDALSEGTRRALERYRERCTAFYLFETGRLDKELRRVLASLVPGREWEDEALEAAAAVRDLLHSLSARFVGEPNRLIRNAEVVSSLAATRTPPAPRDLEPDPCQDLVLTDPPVECPSCGGVLMTDREFTLLRCPACGIAETLDPEPVETDAGGEETDEG
jgi:hypothetical protein